jgi:hypothetical protein
MGETDIWPHIFLTLALGGCKGCEAGFARKQDPNTAFFCSILFSSLHELKTVFYTASANGSIVSEKFFTGKIKEVQFVHEVGFDHYEPKLN